MVTLNFDSCYPYGLGEPLLALHTCSCGQVLVVRDLIPIGVMDDGDGGLLMLANHKPGCGTTLTIEVKP